MPVSSPPPVIVDCDTGIDDAVALVYLCGLHRSGLIRLVGVTCTAGNTTARQAAWNSWHVLQGCGFRAGEVPVCVGPSGPLVVPLVTTPETHGVTGLGYVKVSEPEASAVSEESDAWCLLWRRAALEYGKDLRLIVTGPATSLALFLADQPLFPARVALMGGAYLYPGNTTPTAEWNSWVDPHAAREVMRKAPGSVTVCPLNITERMVCRLPDLERLCHELGSVPIAAELPEMLRFYFEFHERQGEGYLAQLHDLLTCMVALDRVGYTADTAAVEVEADSSLLRGTTVADTRGFWRREPTAQIVREVSWKQVYEEWWAAARVLGSSGNSTLR